jgi:hypothetical protein
MCPISGVHRNIHSHTHTQYAVKWQDPISEEWRIDPVLVLVASQDLPAKATLLHTYNDSFPMVLLPPRFCLSVSLSLCLYSSPLLRAKVRTLQAMPNFRMAMKVALAWRQQSLSHDVIHFWTHVDKHQRYVKEAKMNAEEKYLSRRGYGRRNLYPMRSPFRSFLDLAAKGEVCPVHTTYTPDEGSPAEGLSQIKCFSFVAVHSCISLVTCEVLGFLYTCVFLCAFISSQCVYQ